MRATLAVSPTYPLSTVVTQLANTLQGHVAEEVLDNTGALPVRLTVHRSAERNFFVVPDLSRRPQSQLDADAHRDLCTRHTFRSSAANAARRTPHAAPSSGSHRPEPVHGRVKSRGATLHGWSPLFVREFLRGSHSAQTRSQRTLLASQNGKTHGWSYSHQPGTGPKSYR